MEHHSITRAAPCRHQPARTVGMATCLVVAAILGATSTVVSGKPPDAEPPPAETPDAAKRQAVSKPKPDTAPSPAEQRIREGTPVVDCRGVFKITGDRVTFISIDGRMRLVALENLGLERIVRVVTDSVEKQEWIVSGAVTEYQGVNYVLVERAVLKSQAESNDDRKQPLDAGGRQ